MSLKSEEQLSAFLDGELPPREMELLLARLDREPRQREALARYAMIGEVIRTGRGRVEALDIAEHVRLQLEREARGEVPAAPAAQPEGRTAWLPGAIAATVALVAVLAGVPFLMQGERSLPVEGAVPVAALTDEPLSDITPATARRLNPKAAARLTGYLVAHGQYANQLSRNTFDSHLVSARAERASWRMPQDPQRVR